MYSKFIFILFEMHKDIVSDTIQDNFSREMLSSNLVRSW